MPMRSPSVATKVMKPTKARRLSDSSSSGLHTAETWATADSSSDDEYSSSIPASPSLDSATTAEETTALAEKDRRIEQLQLALDAAIRQIESLHTDRQALKQQTQQDQKRIATLEQEVAQLQQKTTKTATTTPSSSSPASSQPERRNDKHNKDNANGNDDNHHHDNQVRDQIAAVKATLKQGSHQAKANHVSLSQELETSRRLRQKLANRKAARMSSPPASPKKPRNIATTNCTTTTTNNSKKLSLTEQVAALVASVQEREQYMAEIAQTFSSDNSKVGTIPVSLYQAEIQQWKRALHKLQNATPDNDNNSNAELLQETLRQSNQLLQQANEKLHQLEAALAEAQRESKESQLRAGTLFQVVQKLQRDKEEEIHLLDIVMQHLIDLEEEGN